MIKIENVVLPSPEQWKTLIMGARNAKNSWDRSDSRYSCLCMDDKRDCPAESYVIGPNDLDLMARLSNAGTDHRKFMRMITVYMDITAPLYWWKEFDTYKIGTVANSCSTMHKIHAKEFTIEDFSHEHLIDTCLLESIINELNINNYTNVLDKIKVFHDYIANNNKYDKDKLSGNSKYNSDSAIGTLFEGYSICSGYTDTLAIFLSKIGIDNVRVANNSHTWNALLINNEWKHIDLTWDDPITTNNSDVIIYDYYLISSKDITKKNEKEHYYSINVYDFLK